MIRSIHVKALGPLGESTIMLEPNGTNMISGRSESGKTSILEAVCFALWGKTSGGRPFPSEMITDGYKRCSVTVTLSSGTKIHREMSRGRKHSRALTLKGARETYSKEADFQAAIAKLGDQNAVRLVLVPLSWRSLLAGPGGGRPLRDLLTKILPAAGDLRSVVHDMITRAGHDIRPNDPLTERGVVDERRITKREASEAKGRWQQITESLTQARQDPPTGPSAAEVEQARLVLEQANEWDGYLADHALWSDRVNNLADATIRLDCWRAEREKLGDRPGEIELSEIDRLRVEFAESVDALAAASVAQAAAANAAQRADDALLAMPDVDPALDAAQRAHVAAKGHLASAIARRADITDDDRCPTCGKAGYNNAEQSRKDADDVVAAAKRRLDDAIARLNDATDAADRRGRKESIALHQAKADADDAVRVANEEVARCREARDNAAIADERVRASQQSALNWEQALRALGPKPAMPETGIEPTRPSWSQPHSDNVAIAKTIIKESQRTQGVAQEHARNVAKLTSDLTDAMGVCEDYEAEVKRLDALLDAVRRAPSVMAKQQLAALGYLGPVQLSFPPDGAAVEINIDRRPWWLASTGRLIVADAYLRAGVRRAMGKRWLPLVIDRTQDVAGQELPDVAPALLLRTTDTDLTINNKPCPTGRL